MAKLVEKRGRLEALRNSLAEVFEAAGKDLDFNDKEVLDKLGVSDSTAAVEKVREINAEINDLYDEVKGLVELEEIGNDLDSMGRDINRVGSVRHADPQNAVSQGIGDIITGSSAFTNYLKTKNPTTTEVSNFGLREIKNVLFETGAGWAPEALRSGFVADAPTRPLQIIDIIPTGTTSQSAYVYMQESTRVHGAAETAEGAVFAASQFVLTQVSDPVRKITDSVSVTDEQLEDVEGVSSYLNGRLTFGLRQRYDGQVLVGDGIAPNLQGLLNRPGILNQAFVLDTPVPDLVHMAMTNVRVTGRALPSHVLMHPTDWQAVRLLRTQDGIYIWGSPAEAGPERIWGLPVVQSDILTLNQALVGAFNPAMIMAFERRGVDVQVGYVNAQFGQGEKTIRADMRVALAVFRPSAFSTVALA